MDIKDIELPRQSTGILDPSGKPVATKESATGELWSTRISNANKYYDLWANKFRTEELESFYEGFQWPGLNYSDYEPYIYNEFFVAIDIKSPSLLFQYPVFFVTPKPSKKDEDIEGASARANLKQDVLNFFTTSGFLDFDEETEIAILDAFFRFGLVEVGYSADWIDNPNADKPILSADGDPLLKGSGEVEKEPEKLPTHERIYIKHIPSKNFRVGGIDSKKLSKCSWCGYWEYMRTEDLLTIANLTEWAGSPHLTYGRTSDFSTVTSATIDEEQELLKQGDITKIWKIWDLRSKEKLYFVEPLNEIIKKSKFERLPLFPLKFRDRLFGFYPKPLASDWLSPQKEVNENRESNRAHRRAFMRKYIVPRAAFDEAELDKLERGGDGTFAKTEFNDAQRSIAPVPNANLGAQHVQSIELSRSDFDNIAGISPEQRGQTEGGTATEASIIERRSTIRENRDREKVRKWLVNIGKEILLQAKERLTSDFWIEVQKDQPGQIFDLVETENQFKLVSPDELGNEDFEVNISLESLSPVANDEEKKKYMEFVSTLSAFQVLALSPTLVRETAERIGYRNERVIADIQKMAQLVQFQQMAQLEGGADAQSGNEDNLRSDNAVAQRRTAQMTPNTQEQITNQLRNQGNLVQ